MSDNDHKKDARDNLAEVHLTTKEIQEKIEKVMSIPQNNVAGTNIDIAKKREQQEQALNAVKKANEETEQVGKRHNIDVKPSAPTNQEPAAPEPNSISSSHKP